MCGSVLPIQLVHTTGWYKMLVGTVRRLPELRRLAATVILIPARDASPGGDVPAYRADRVKAGYALGRLLAPQPAPHKLPVGSLQVAEKLMNFSAGPIRLQETAGECRKREKHKPVDEAISNPGGKSTLIVVETQVHESKQPRP